MMDQPATDSMIADSVPASSWVEGSHDLATVTEQVCRITESRRPPRAWIR